LSHKPSDSNHAGGCREIAVAARVHPRLGSDPVLTAVVVENDRGNPFAFPLRLAHEAVQEDIDARLRAEPIERQLHRVGVEHHLHAAMPLGPCHGIQASQSVQDVLRNAPHGLLWCVTEREEPAIGQHVAHRRSAAQEAHLVQEQCPCAKPCGADRRSHTRRTPATS